MTVKELKEIISNLPDEMEVMLSSDSEGNSYGILDGFNDDSVCVNGKVYSMDWSSDDACLSEDQWQQIKSNPRVLLLYPL
jgi:hypothetical protein